MKNKIIASFIFAVLIIGGTYFYIENKNNSEFPEVQTNITFPKGGETLVTGDTYTIKWDDPESLGTTTAIFLIDTSLLSQGASVSIVDRIYGVVDKGSYDYTVPLAVADGEYFFVVGTTMSKRFNITSSRN